VDDVSVKQGDFVSRYDAGGILIGSKVADPPGADAPFARLNGAILMETQQLVGDEVELKSRTFIVRGVMAEYGSAMMFDVDNMVFISLDAARAFFGFRGYSAIFIDVRGPENVDKAASDLEGLFGDDVDIITSQQILEIVESITSVITLFLGGIAAISLVVAGIGIANIMFVSVMERTREIGVLKALGFQRGDILWLFLSEALLTGIVGGILGCGVGILFGYGITSFFAGGAGDGGGGGFAGGGGGGAFAGGGGVEFVINPSFPPNLFIIAIGFAVIVAALAGLYPSWKAAKMDPVDALREE
jgi:ABC-type antimicrobial peptide transport system permease subunit